MGAEEAGVVVDSEDRLPKTSGTRELTRTNTGEIDDPVAMKESIMGADTGVDTWADHLFVVIDLKGEEGDAGDADNPTTMVTDDLLPIMVPTSSLNRRCHRHRIQLTRPHRSL